MKPRGLGNTDLVEYGILQEESDFRAHVCVKACRVYVFETEAARKVVAAGVFPERPVYTDGICTARGVLVPMYALPYVAKVTIPNNVQSWILASHDTGTKGARAARLVRDYVQRGRIPLPLKTKTQRAVNVQLAGVDLVVADAVRIQVKCDYHGGPRALGGTGNLFIQTHECNPWRKF